jgi:hypothetical protein
MRKTFVVVLSALTLVVGLATLADAAAKPAYKVTLRTSVAKSTADHFITVSGKVTGPKAARHTVTIQRQYVGGPWITVAHATIRSNGRYSASVETPKGGTTSFRALKAKSSARRAGTSAVRSIPVYQWIYLAGQSSLNDSTVQPGIVETVDGRTAPSVDVFGNAEVSYKLGGLCTQLATVAAYSGPSGPASINLDVVKTPTNGGPSTTVPYVVSTGTSQSILTPLSGFKYLIFETSNYDTSYKLVLGNPRAYCNADHLPVWVEADLK